MRRNRPCRCAVTPEWRRRPRNGSARTGVTARCHPSTAFTYKCPPNGKDNKQFYRAYESRLSRHRIIFSLEPPSLSAFTALRLPIPIGRAVWTGKDKFVTVPIPKPYFPVVWTAVKVVGGIAMAGQDYFRFQTLGARNRCVKILNFEPQEHTVARS